MVERTFDVFLAYNSQDKALIRQIYDRLKQKGIRPWFDAVEIPPGQLFQPAIQQAIGQVRSAAIFLGSERLGQWQAIELQTLISQSVQQGIPVIPVLLPSVTEIPQELLFLRQFCAVQFEQSIEEQPAFDHLEWGITGIKPEQVAGPVSDASPPVSPISFNRLKSCDPARILFLKNVKDPSGRWAYSLAGFQETEDPRFELMWRLSSHGSSLPKAGDLMILHQQARVTHVVELLDDEVRQTEFGYFRWVRPVWLPTQRIWHQLPHQREILGFSPRYADGNTHAIASPNFVMFNQTWERLEDFQNHVVQRLMEI